MFDTTGQGLSEIYEKISDIEATLDAFHDEYCGCDVNLKNRIAELDIKVSGLLNMGEKIAKLVSALGLHLGEPYAERFVNNIKKRIDEREKQEANNAELPQG